MKVFAESQPTKVMACFPYYPFAQTWQVVPDQEDPKSPIPCYAGMPQGSILFYCTIGGNVGQSVTNGVIIGKYAGITSFGEPLIAASADEYHPWGCENQEVGMSDVNYTDGMSNTNIALLSGCAKAPQVCRNKGVQWFLPATQQFSSTIGKNYLALGVSTSAYYWTSTASGPYIAGQIYYTGSVFWSSRNSINLIRCVRYF